MIILREYQKDTINGLREGFRAGHNRQVLSASTGSGKSIIALEMVRSAIEKGTRTIFICERRNLIEQFSVHLDKEKIDHGIIMSGHWRWRPDLLIQVASAQTLERMDAWPDFQLCFIDEVHANMRKSIVKMLDVRKNLKVVGLTATPFNPLLSKYFTNVVSAPPMRELVGMGNLVPFRVFVAHEIDTDGVKVVAGEWQKDQLEERGRRIIGDVVTDYLKLSSMVFGRKSKAICFSCGIAHGADLVQSFADAGVNAVQLASGVDDGYKSDVLAEFSRAESSIDVLISVDMLSRGFDQTDIEHVILARPLKKSFSQHVQMIGRGARSHNEKKLCVVQDHASNWLRFEHEWNEFFHEGVKTLTSDADKKSKKEPTKKEKEAAKCPKCSAFFPGSMDICAHCGYVRVKHNKVVNDAGEMLELTPSKKEKHSTEEKNMFYWMMLWWCKQHNKSEGCAYHWHHTKYGVYPSCKKQYVVASVEVANYCRSRLIAYSKSQRKSK